MLISAGRLGKDKSALLLLIPSQHGHHTDQKRRTQVETWNSVTISAQTETVWPRHRELDLAKLGNASQMPFCSS